MPLFVHFWYQHQTAGIKGIGERRLSLLVILSVAVHWLSSAGPVGSPEKKPLNRDRYKNCEN